MRLRVFICAMILCLHASLRLTHPPVSAIRSLGDVAVPFFCPFTAALWHRESDLILLSTFGVDFSLSSTLGVGTGVHI